MTKRHPKHELFEDTPDAIIWDYAEVRKAKRLPITATAISKVKREAEKAGLTLCQAITICAEEGWAGFKVDWYIRLTEAPKAATSGPPWWSSDTAILAKGETLGLRPHRGENMFAFKGRVQAAVDNGGVAPVIRQSRVIEPIPEQARGRMPEGLNLKALIRGPES